MPQFKLESKGNDASLTLEYESEKSIDSHFNSHMLKDAIVELIYSADTGMWVKREDAELQPDDFFRAILHVVADSYRQDLPYESDDISDIELLQQLMESSDGSGE